MNAKLKSSVEFICNSATQADIDSIYQALLIGRDRLARMNRRALTAGTKVNFSSRGVDYTGVIKSIKIKKAVVECPVAGTAYNGKMERVPATVLYNVPLNMLVAA